MKTQIHLTETLYENPKSPTRKCGGFAKARTLRLCRLSLNDPPTAVGGIRGSKDAALV